MPAKCMTRRLVCVFIIIKYNICVVLHLCEDNCIDRGCRYSNLCSFFFFLLFRGPIDGIIDITLFYIGIIFHVLRLC